jgi:hypothetical protein
VDLGNNWLGFRKKGIGRSKRLEALQHLLVHAVPEANNAGRVASRESGNICTVQLKEGRKKQRRQKTDKMMVVGKYSKFITAVQTRLESAQGGWD